MKKELDLSGLWELKPVAHFDGDYQKGEWASQEIPGHWQELEQFRNYSGRMVYRKRFSFKPEKGKRYWLKFGGVFYWFAAYLNGFRLGASQGYFMPGLFEVTESLKNDNELLLEVLCDYEQNKIGKKQILGVFHHWDCLYRDFCPGGIWQPAAILSTGPAAIITPMFQTLYLHPKYARIQGRVSFDSRENEELDFKISLSAENHNGPGAENSWAVYKSSGVKTYQYQFDLKEYRLWSTWDAGEPHFYRLRLEVKRKGEAVESDTSESLFGVRTFELRDYVAYLNGKRLMLRGSNYAPGDYLIAKMTEERFQKDFELAKNANMNILRVHAHIEKPEFYERADRMGILLWQDFPLQWNYDKKVMPEAIFQVQEMIKLLFNHPSAALWCMHNEPVKMFDTGKKPSLFGWARLFFSCFVYSWNREVMDKALLEKAKFMDPFRPSLQCSGEKGIFAKDSGDSHLFFGWHYGKLGCLSRLLRKKPERLKLVSEFGARSFPNFENSIKFMPADLNKLDWEELDKSYLAQPYYLKKFIALKNHEDLKSYIQATQDWQSIVNRYYIDRIRSLKYRPAGGALQFDFNDCNPAITWSVIDYWRQPKSSYFELKKSFSPVYAFALIDRLEYKFDRKIAIPIFAVNDLYQDIDANLSVRLVSPISEELYKEAFEFKLEADCPAKALANPIVVLRWPGEYRLELNLSWLDKELQNNYTFKVSG